MTNNINNNQYSFVIDSKNNKLSPCKINKAWYLIRKGKAIQINKYPMTIQLKKEIKEVLM